MFRPAVVFILFTALFITVSVSAQGPNPQASVGGEFDTGVWLEQWSQEGRIECANHQQFVTSSNEPFILSSSYSDNLISIDYGFSGVHLDLATLTEAPGLFVTTTEDARWIHFLQVSEQSPDQMNVTSIFYAKGGGCMLSNTATWSYIASSDSCTIWAKQTTTRRAGPGNNFPISGQLQPLGWAQAIGSNQGWWQLQDGTWVSSRTTAALGACQI